MRPRAGAVVPTMAWLKPYAFAADGTVTLTRSVGADITTDASTALALLTGATFTGAVSGVTPADDDNSTQFATTEFVADGFHGASFTNATRRLVLSRLGGGAVASLPLTFLNASHGTDPIVAAEYHQGDTVKVGGNVYYYNANISATIATSAVATDTRFDNLTVGSVTPVGDGTAAIMALGADAVFTEVRLHQRDGVHRRHGYIPDVYGEHVPWHRWFLTRIQSPRSPNWASWTRTYPGFSRR